jgi:hypothetical protein
VQIHPAAPVNGRLPVQRAVIGVLGYDHLGEQSYARQRTLERARGRWQLDHSRAVCAGQLGAYMPDHLEVTGYEIEQLRDVFAKLAHRTPAVGTSAAGGRMHDGLARQVFG